MSNNIFKWHTSQFVLLPHPCYLREVKILNSNIHRLILHIEEAVRPRTQSCFVTLSRQSTSEHAAYICGKLRLHGPKRRSTRAGVVVRVPAFHQWGLVLSPRVGHHTKADFVVVIVVFVFFERFPFGYFEFHLSSKTLKFQFELQCVSVYLEGHGFNF